MDEEGQGTEGNCCANCGSPIPPSAILCDKCSCLSSAEKKPVRRSFGEVSRSVAVKETPDGCIRRGVYYGFLTEEQGDLLLRLMSEGSSLAPSVRSVLLSLTKEIAEERHAQRREDRAYVLLEFVNAVMSSVELSRDILRAFQLK